MAALQGACLAPPPGSVHILAMPAEQFGRRSTVKHMAASLHTRAWGQTTFSQRHQSNLAADPCVHTCWIVYVDRWAGDHPGFPVPGAHRCFARRLARGSPVHLAHGPGIGVVPAQRHLEIRTPLILQAATRDAVLPRRASSLRSGRHAGVEGACTPVERAPPSDPSFSRT